MKYIKILGGAAALAALVTPLPHIAGMEDSKLKKKEILQEKMIEIMKNRVPDKYNKNADWLHFSKNLMLTLSAYINPDTLKIVLTVEPELLSSGDPLDKSIALFQTNNWKYLHSARTIERTTGEGDRKITIEDWLALKCLLHGEILGTTSRNRLLWLLRNYLPIFWQEKSNLAIPGLINGWLYDLHEKIFLSDIAALGWRCDFISLLFEEIKLVDILMEQSQTQLDERGWVRLCEHIRLLQYVAVCFADLSKDWRSTWLFHGLVRRLASVSHKINAEDMTKEFLALIHEAGKGWRLKKPTASTKKDPPTKDILMKAICAAIRKAPKN
ncbi:MAG: hypothetical protein LBJ16_03145 [Holosporaceae bacterium]|jgi:hypothetical protein|nr:hypothetical protein [Holosporaceae bacterium]